jgi:spermidine synthase
MGPDGPLTLRRAAGGFEIVRNEQAGERVILSSNIRRAEGELANISLVPLRDRTDVTVLLAGLGMGYLLSALLQHRHVQRVDVVEHNPAIIEWNRTHLSTLHASPPLADERVRVYPSGLAKYLRDVRYGVMPEPKLETEGYFLALLDVDDGPSALSRPQNEDLYSDDGLMDLEEVLRPGGVLCIWASQREPALLERLKARFQNIAEIATPVDVPGHPGLDYVYRCRRRPNPSKNPTRAQA